MNMERAKYWETQQAAVRLLNQRCPRLSRQCYWAGTSAIAIEELHHRLSFDLDFHTLRALSDVRPILAELQNAFPGAFEIVQAPDEFGSGFGGVWTLPDGVRITVEARSNFEGLSWTHFLSWRADRQHGAERRNERLAGEAITLLLRQAIDSGSRSVLTFPAASSITVCSFLLHQNGPTRTSAFPGGPADA